ncbi:trehalose-phosphatase [Haloarchaeobius sp. HRN-SO-5]|uniref:trehalose-phosphatase n=1 Tax=Haloarchaeobius sp. HRN-SO-5 TaxID=3446118 RepID=UPI003EBCAAFA
MTGGNDERTAVPVSASSDDLEELLAATNGLFVGLDFDGTLAPIATDPTAPTITPANRHAVDRLASRPNVSVAVVSGRALSDLVERVGVDAVTYSGNHGLERRHDGERTVTADAAEYRPAMQSLVDRLRDDLDDVPGALVEDKELTLTVHYRRTPSAAIEAVRSAVDRAVSSVDSDLLVVDGKGVFEVRPAVDHDKGTVVSDLADDTPVNWLPMYVGDDTTDEDAFEAIAPGGVGVLVGERDETAATHRLPSQADVAPFLDWLVEKSFEQA